MVGLRHATSEGMSFGLKYADYLRRERSVVWWGVCGHISGMLFSACNILGFFREAVLGNCEFIPGGRVGVASYVLLGAIHGWGRQFLWLTRCVGEWDWLMGRVKLAGGWCGVIYFEMGLSIYL